MFVPTLQTLPLLRSLVTLLGLDHLTQPTCEPASRLRRVTCIARRSEAPEQIIDPEQCLRRCIG